MEGFASLPPDEFWFWTVALGAGGVLLLGLGLMLLRRARLMEDTPTAKIRSASQGYTELNGYARLLEGPEIRSPLTGQRCAWWSYSIEERQTVWRGGKRSRDWKVIEKATSEELFLLHDGSGQCVVDPFGAKVYPSLKRVWQGRTHRPVQVPRRTPLLSFGNYRYREQQVHVGDALYALGLFRTQTAIQEFNQQREVRDLLAEWKLDRAQMLKRFDADGDGQIDLQEWEAARRAALEQVRKQQVERSLEPDIHVLSRPTDRRPFILSTLSQLELVRRYRLGGFLSVLMGGGASVMCALALQARGLI